MLKPYDKVLDYLWNRMNRKREQREQEIDNFFEEYSFSLAKKFRKAVRLKYEIDIADRLVASKPERSARMGLTDALDEYRESLSQV